MKPAAVSRAAAISMAGRRRGRHITIVVCCIVFLAMTGGSATAGPRVGRLVTSRSRSFVSVWQPRGASSPVVAQFSLRTGALLSTLARYDSSQDQVSSPQPDSRGDLWITHTIGPGCSYHISVDCGPPVADSCSSTVTRLDPATGTMQPVLTFASSVLVSEAVPSPSPDVIAFVAGGCATSYFNSHFVIENLRKHRSWSIGADAEVCHSLSAPAWNRSGSKLVFTYGPSTLKAGQTYTQDFPGGERCLPPRAAGIVIVPASHASDPASWAFIPPRRGCSYTSAAFDALGIAAFEACAPGRHGSPANDDLGPASVVQLDKRGRVRFRIALKISADPGTVMSDPGTDVVLITQDQTYERDRPTRNWVWQLRGHKLRLIASYPFDGQPVIAAQPWSQRPVRTDSRPPARPRSKPTVFRDLTAATPDRSTPVRDLALGRRPYFRATSVNCSRCETTGGPRVPANNLAAARSLTPTQPDPNRKRTRAPVKARA